MKLRWMLRLAAPRPQDHVSIWSVAARDARTFFWIVASLWLAALAHIVYKTCKAQSPAAGWQAAADLAVAVLADFGSVSVGAAAVAMLLSRVVNIVGGILLSLYQAMVNRFVLPVIEEHKAQGREEGRAEGRAEGREEGRAEGLLERQKAIAEWVAWNQRRLEAERASREFAEPPPSG